jgi:organic hydroperoxide reductase OsmC/OhrA
LGRAGERPPRPEAASNGTKGKAFVPLFSLEEGNLMGHGKHHDDKTHRYRTVVTWTGNTGAGTANYGSYQRSHDIDAAGKAKILGSADPAFRGEATRWNPEELLVAALSACHKLWYLHLCALAGVIVVGYVDEAEGLMVEDAARGGYFTGVTLRPAVKIARGSDAEKARALHGDAHAKCFIANSVNFTVAHEATITLD